MKTMPNIKITMEDFQILRYAGYFKDGGEAVICKGNRSDTLYKIFYDEKKKQPRIMSDNKYQKILHQFNQPLDYSVQSLSTISLDDELIGYEMTYDVEDEAMTPNLPRQELITYLRQARNILEYYASKDIIYGDIKANNILVNRRTKTVKFCDMDNIQLGQYPIDLVGYDLSCFKAEHGSIDDTSDAYMHNLLTLEQLSYKEKTFQSILYTLSAGNRPKHYQKQAYRIMQQMVRAESFQGEYLIQYVKNKVIK